MSILLSTLLLVAIGIVIATMRGRDDTRLRASLRDVPGDIVECKLISLGNEFRTGKPRIYRIVFELPNGSRLLHRVALHQDGSAERLL